METPIISGKSQDNKPSRRQRLINILRYTTIVASAVVFGIYVLNNSAYKPADFVYPFITLAAAVGILCGAMPQIVNTLIGCDESAYFNNAEKNRTLRTFILICLGALALHIITYLLGVFIFKELGDTDDASWLARLWQRAWMKSNTDARHYINIAENWYQVEGDDRLLLVFFPMLPVLIRTFNLIFNNSYVSALFINTIATMLTSGMTYKTLIPILGDKKARIAAFITLLLPGAIFLNSPMTEPLFMLFSVCGFFFLQKHNYIAAGLFTALAGFTRSLGVLLAIPIAIVGIGHIVSLIRAREPFKAVLFKLIAGLAISTFGTLGYLYINYSLHGDPLKFFEFQWENWHQKACPFFDTPRYMVHFLCQELEGKSTTAYSLWIPGLIAVFGSLGIVGAKARKLPSFYTVYFLCYFAVAIGCTWLLSAVRYLCAALPVTAAIAHNCDKWWKTAIIIAVLGIAYAVYMVMYMERLSIY